MQQQQQKDTKKCNYLQLMYKIESDFVPGRPGTEEFVPGFLLLPLSRDKGTAGQGNIFVPGQRDNGTSRPGLSRDVPRDVPSRGNANNKGIQLATRMRVGRILKMCGDLDCSSRKMARLLSPSIYLAFLAS